MKNLFLNSIIIATIIAGCSNTTSPIFENENDDIPINIDGDNSKGNEADSVYTNDIGMTFVRVKAGSFQMGSTVGNENEKPVHTVEITEDFYLGIHEVTQQQWAEIMGANNSFFIGDSLPVERISYGDIQDFITALNNQERGAAYRLPTEAEWEYAARGGHKSDGFIFPGSENLDELAWYGANAQGKTHNVGLNKPNALGLYDMAGNVWEWCLDWYGATYYDVRANVDPTGPNTGVARVLRGGSWGSNASQCRVSSRSSIEPDNRASGIGFRLLRAYP